MPDQRGETEDFVRAIAQKEGVDPDLLLSIGTVESGLNFQTKPSEKGALGIMQIMPATAKGFAGLNVGDPYDNVVIGAKLLRQLELEGKGNYDFMLRRWNGSPSAPVEATDPFVEKVMADYRRRVGLPPAKPGEDTGGRVSTSRTVTPGAQVATPPGKPPDVFGQLQSETFNRVRGMGVGALKGAGHTATTLGGLVQQIPGVTAATDWLYGAPPGFSERAMQTMKAETAPTTPAEKVGYGIEQVAETLLPTSAINKARAVATAATAPRLAPYVGKTLATLLPGAAVEGAASAGIAAAQGGDPKTAAALGAAIPVVGKAVGATAGRLEQTAGKRVMQALGPTSQRFKAIAERLTPQILKRGLGGSRESLLAHARDMLGKTDVLLDAEKARVGQQGANSQQVWQALEDAKSAFRTQVPNPATGAMQTVVFDERTINHLSNLQQVIRDLGPSPTVEQLTALRKVWDNVVSLAGGFEHRAPGQIGLPLGEASEAWAKREGAGAIRKLLSADFPDLGALNREWSFWKGLKDVLHQTVRRTKPHELGLGQRLAGGAYRVGGMALGAAVGSKVPGLGPWLGGAAGQMVGAEVQKILSSPGYRFLSARARYNLAEAMMNGDTQAIARVAARVAGLAVSGAVGTPPPQRPANTIELTITGAPSRR
jgi:Transglycosylase SLT domain